MVIFMRANEQDRASYLKSVSDAIIVITGYVTELESFRSQIEKNSISPKGIELTNYLLRIKYRDLVEPVLDEVYFFRTKLKRKKKSEPIKEKIIDFNTLIELVDLGHEDLSTKLGVLLHENPLVLYRPELICQGPGNNISIFS